MSEKEIMYINDNFTVVLDYAPHFKSTAFSLYIMEQLGSNATKFALLPLVLKHGSENFPTLKEIEAKLDDMYGAQFNIDVFKKGNIQIADYYLSVLNDVYADGSSLIEEGLKFLNEILFNPLIKENEFNPNYVKIDKENLGKMIEARINDKRTYAIERCIELMCKDDPYAIYPLGRLEDLNQVDERILAEYYDDLLHRTKIVLVITGCFETNDLLQKINDNLNVNITSKAGYQTGDLIKEISEPHYYNEVMDVAQAKLSIGYTTSVHPTTDDYFGLLLLNAVLGGGPQSKLFVNVREKESLAYYASSRIERFKGILEVYCGIDIDNYENVVNIIDRQVEDLRNGNISNHELDASKAELINAFRSISDSPKRRSDFYLSEWLTGNNYTPEDYIEKISKLSMDDLVKLANKLNKHTVYLLNNKIN